MRFDLFDYQRAAAVDCVDRLVQARDGMAKSRLSSFGLSAITGSGKTVIATAVIEGFLHGSADLEIDPDPRACFLWVTDDPALNNQTRNKMWQSSDLLNPAQLQIIDNDFMDAELSPGTVYFLNIQKLSKSAGLSRSGSNQRQYSMWDVLANTIQGGRVDLYLVLDEAHRGMKSVRERRSIVQSIINGQHGSNPPVPAVWGISATIERFTHAMQGMTDRNQLAAVEVDIDKVRASGLVKDEIGLDEPDESGTFSTTLLREAVKALLDFDRRWDEYARSENEPRVLPIMVVQVPDKASDDKLAELVEVIESSWPGVGPYAFAHVFGDHDTITLPTRTLRWIPPESIQGDADIRVVFAKEAISTGWDCPRAEVLYSERPANDATHIAQIIGRMVRQPLAHRIATDDALNTVACFLPNFNRLALGVIKAELEGRGAGGVDAGTGAEVARKPVVFERSPSVDPAVFEFIETLPSIPAPDTLVSPLRRARSLARLLTDDVSGAALFQGAGAALTKLLNARLDGMAAEHAEQVATNIDDLRTTNLWRSRFDASGNELPATSRQIETHLADLGRDTQRIIRSLREGAGMDYYRHRARAAPDADLLDLRTEVAALLMIPAAVDSLEARATEWVQQQLTTFNVEIKNTTGATRDAYRRIEEQSLNPEAVTVALRDNVSVATVDGDGGPLPRFDGHIFCDVDGTFPARFNQWESDIITAEAGRTSFVGWYRNPSRPSPAALRIAYRDDSGDWTSLQPDFLVISRRGDGSFGASLIDPHGDHLSDSRAKLRALADFAETYGGQFVRIESISKVGGDLRLLDLLDAPTRELVREFDGADTAVLYESDRADIYHAS